MDGDFVGPVGLARAGDKGDGAASAAAVVPVEDATEVMVQIVLHAERNAGSGRSPRIVELFTPVENKDAGSGVGSGGRLSRDPTSTTLP